MNTEANETRPLPIPADRKRRGAGATWLYAVIAMALALALFAYYGNREEPEAETTVAVSTNATTSAAATGLPKDTALTVSGYVIPRERIEISPRFQATVKWIGVKKGDRVAKDTVLVELEDDEFRARVAESEGRAASARAQADQARRELDRASALSSNRIDSAADLDRARANLETSQAEERAAEGALTLAKTYLSWCTIRAPIDGTILEKLVNPNELVVPQSFGGGRGPSTAFLAMADLRDLQVEVDINEADTPKVRIGQRCRISPEAYPEKQYEGTVAEIAPEANRSKGTLQVKVQVREPDAFLTPELSARVDFLIE